MEFHITMNGPIHDMGAIEQAVCEVDPSALVDIDPAGPTLRVAAAIDATRLASLISQAGYPVRLDQVAQLPSICCGGCSG